MLREDGKNQICNGSIAAQDLQKSSDELWLFGYGSLMYKPPLHDHPDISSQFIRHTGKVRGFIRRFWQSSYDNRGTLEYRGRVVTIVPVEDVRALESAGHNTLIGDYELKGLSKKEQSLLLSGADDEKLANLLSVEGVCFHVPAGDVARKAREYLDFREKDGYTIQSVLFEIGDNQADANGRTSVHCDVYVGTLDNESWIGTESIESTAKIIAKAEGDSGRNDEYLFLLQKECPEDRYLADLVKTVNDLQND